MKIQISIEYNTVWGEKLYAVIGGKAHEMRCVYAGLWQLELDRVPAAALEEYRYELRRDDQVIAVEWMPHHIRLDQVPDTLILRDSWNARPKNSPFWTQFFRDVVFRRPVTRVRTRTEGNVSFEIAAAEVRSDQAVAICGSGRLFGEWKKMILLDDAEFPLWKVSLAVREPFEYKFVIVDRKTHEPVLWEEGSNHFFAEVPRPGVKLVVADVAPVFPTLPWRGAGVAVPVFSLRSADSFGVGEFNDIKKLVDWAVATGQNVIQLLPINDTTMTGSWQDSYPYNANTTFALHPQFLHLPSAGVRADKQYKALRDELNALPQVDYERVNSEKDRLLRKTFASSREEILSSPAYQDFVEANKEWLTPYAAFCCLRDEFGTPEFSKWGRMAVYSPRKVASYVSAHSEQADYYRWVQFCLDAQLKEVVAYAHSKGVALKGDLPIGISRTSVDAWAYPELYHLDSQAGAPPDAFAVDGQNWGFPTYNWEKMSEDGFAWWKSRMRKMSEYFDAFRIDHILGFFRIWEIPIRYKSGLMGHFSPALPYSAEELRALGFDMEGGRYSTPAPGHGETDVLFIEDPRKPGYYHPRISAQLSSRAYAELPDGLKQAFNELYNDFFFRRHNDFWRSSAMSKLPSLLSSTDMLTCGEDLGMIPDCVPSVMSELGILSLEIQRMPKSVTEEFANPAAYPYECVCATGTHDTSPMRAWWEEDREATGRFYNSMLGCQGEAPYYCEPWVCEKILQQHLKSPAMLCILPLQDWLSADGAVRYQGNPADERINVPAIPRYYWRYRMHLNLEDLLRQTALNSRLKALVRSSGRNM